MKSSRPRDFFQGILSNHKFNLFDHHRAIQIIHFIVCELRLALLPASISDIGNLCLLSLYSVTVSRDLSIFIDFF